MSYRGLGADGHAKMPPQIIAYGKGGPMRLASYGKGGPVRTVSYGKGGPLRAWLERIGIVSPTDRPRGGLGGWFGGWFGGYRSGSYPLRRGSGKRYPGPTYVLMDGLGQDMVEYSKGGVRPLRGGIVSPTDMPRSIYPGPRYVQFRGDESLTPAPKQPLNVAAIVGWGLVVTAAAGVFWAVTSGAGLKRNKRRARRNGKKSTKFGRLPVGSLFYLADVNAAPDVAALSGPLRKVSSSRMQELFTGTIRSAPSSSKRVWLKAA